MDGRTDADGREREREVSKGRGSLTGKRNPDGRTEERKTSCIVSRREQRRRFEKVSGRNSRKQKRNKNSNKHRKESSGCAALRRVAVVCVL